VLLFHDLGIACVQLFLIRLDSCCRFLDSPLTGRDLTFSADLLSLELQYVVFQVAYRGFVLDHLVAVRVCLVL
jgi:hypothetical protein